MRWRIPAHALALLAFGEARADQIKALNRGDQSLAAYYGAIQSAKKTIDVATYVIEPCDAAPKVLLNALLKKAKAGVKVRFVIEAWLFQEPTKAYLPLYLATESGGNFEMRIYGTRNLLEGDRPRLHVKALLVDAGTANPGLVMGGRNWTDEYFGVSAKMNYVDQDLLIAGKAATDARKFFDVLWRNSSPTVQIPRGGITAPTATAGPAGAWAKRCLAPAARDQRLEQYVRANMSSILGARPTRSCSNVTYVMDDPMFMAAAGETSGEEILSQDRLQKKYSTQLWLAFLNGTVNKVSLLNQYYMPWSRVSDALAALRKRKKVVEVFANATGDVENAARNRSFTCWLQKSAQETNISTQSVHLLTSRGALRDSWAQSVSGAPWRIHAKTGVRDGADVIVGSWNMDPRSYATNLEDAVLIQGCPALAADVEQVYEQMLATAKADRYCSACGADAQPIERYPIFGCGGAPTFY